jgi:lysophospholipase L1-like esterase
MVWRRLRSGLAAALIGTAGLFVVLEGGARLAERVGSRRGPDRIAPQETLFPFLHGALPASVEPDEQFGYRLRPGGTFPAGPNAVIHINAQGFRGPALALSKPTGTYRVLTLGGSTTFGWAVDEEATYPSRLEERLRQRCIPALGDRIEVVNGGVPGYQSSQTALRFEADWVRYAPDMVLLMEGLNDLLAAEPQAAGSDQPPEVSSRWLVASAWQVRVHQLYAWSRAHSAAVRWLDQTMRPMAPMRREGGPSLHRVLERSLDRIDRVARASGVELIIVRYPGPHELKLETLRWPAPVTDTTRPTPALIGLGRYAEMADRLAQWAARRQRPLVALDEAFALAPAQSLYQSDGLHFTPEGNEFIAAVIEEQVFGSRCPAGS